MKTIGNRSKNLAHEPAEKADEIQLTVQALKEKLGMLEAAVEYMDQGISVTDSNLICVVCNQRFLDLLDFPADQFRQGMPFEAFIRYNAEHGEHGPGDPEQQVSERMALAAKFVPHRFNRIKKDGTVLEIVGNIMDDGGFVTTYTDITAREQSEQALRNSEQRFRALYDNNPSMFFTLDVAGEILSVNRFGANQLGYSVEELVGMTVFDLSSPAETLRLKENIKRCLDSPDAVVRWEIAKHLKGGGDMWVREVVRAVTDAENQVCIMSVCQDITDARELSDQLSYHANHDALTGLLNRWAFENRMEAALVSCHQQQIEHAICYLDLDQFKVINDTCGHVAGDELLRQLGILLPQHVRRNDTLARLGGDEFGVLLENCTLRQACRVANDLRKSIEEFRFVWGAKTFSLGASIGLVLVTGQDQSLVEILAAADAACYVAKDSGRNRIHVYHEEDSELSARKGEMQWLNRTQQALSEDRFCLYYQPIDASTDSDNTLHYEVLLRMLDEQGEIILPGAFLPAAERYDLMPRLDRWVLEKTLSLLGANPRHLARLSQCAINLSGQSVTDHGFTDFVIETLQANSVPADKICFEITETTAIGNLVGAIQFINTLKALGCRFALDDFGSGMSSFAYLKTLPVDYLKIDGVFISDMMDDPINLAMVQSINSIAQVMGKATIAEFVESEAIYDCLVDMGVDYLQGYHISRPQPLAQLLGNQTTEVD